MSVVSLSLRLFGNLPPTDDLSSLLEAQPTTAIDGVNVFQVVELNPLMCGYWIYLKQKIPNQKALKIKCSKLLQNYNAWHQDWLV